ncbi:radical SAM superfamily protein [Clostridioides difficile]|uniref:Radical SAM superfamily protein n=6 Tax=Clostridioides difficile TaxID=1496 RepID=A0A9R0BIA8_CLODR|nr:radical SAM protein [Clostridioides difficile]OFU01063.1 radical SAM protein [Clostridium sp. HMSC19E03]OFU19504.1 radical SAM protein [Clostridium sp. HMSC19C08]OFU21637.1 radical SAM protein [Clostridium sp. HMSC19C09]OFU24298.1 radical SAM protein [Clostridium sp. HMSC19C05]OFU33479.1 radical SAM protein [Clostridium sp. HMSC19B10]OFU41764.1 radical SAM protein [Clostridium sp. HMSC19B01]
MIESIPAKQILQKVKFDNTRWFGIDYNMNLYRGCSHGCIYCDSRSTIYNIENFDKVRYKENVIEILSKELRSKRKKGVVGIGAMSDTYNPFEKQLCITKQALDLISENHFGVSIDTKSSLVVRDIPILQKIKKNNSAIVKLTITTANDELSKKIEPYVNPSSARFDAVKELNDSGIFCGILLTPMLPFLTDNKDEIRAIVEKAHKANAKFIYCMYGVTMRSGQREFFYEHLRDISPKLVLKYQKTYGLNYVCTIQNKDSCEKLLREECARYGILTDMKEIIKAYKRSESYIQIKFF